MTQETFASYGIDIPSGAIGEVDVTCPQCSPKRKKRRDRCLSVNIEEGSFFCHHCGWAGRLGGRKESDQRAPRVYSKPKPISESGISSDAMKWLVSRGITEEVVKRNRITSGKTWMPQVESETTVIQFPYYRDGELINIKHRDGRKNFRMEKGAERILFGLGDIDPHGTVIVEGEMDKLACEVAGWSNCVSVPDGAPPPDTKNYASKFEFLESDRERIEAVEQWIVAVDNDRPGECLRDELCRRFGREKCLIVSWPEGCKDANDVLIQYGPDSLSSCLMSAKPLPITGTFTAEDLSDRIDHLYEHGWERGVNTGWFSLDPLYTVRPGEFTVVTGIPNSGKSNFIDALCVNLARDHGWNLAMFSPENQPLEDHMARVMEKWAGLPFHDGPTRRIDPAGKEVAKRWVRDHFTWILPDDDSEWTIDTVLDRARQLVYRRGIRGLVIDPWNEMEHLCPRDLTETQYISQSLKRIRQFGRRYSVHVWIVVHPTKLYRDKDGQYPVPSLYDCAGAAHWRNKADNGLCIWREFGDRAPRTIDVHVQKIRFRQIGKLGMATLEYDNATGSYRDPSTRYYGGRDYARASGGED